MYMDNAALFSNVQAITATAASTNALDLGTNTLEDYPGKALDTVIQIIQAFNTLTSLSIEMQSAATVAFSTINECWTKTFLLAALTANTILPAPPVSPIAAEFLRLYYTVNGSNPSTGTITSFLTLDRQQNKPTLGLPQG